jgi:hypothetical protein
MTRRRWLHSLTGMSITDFPPDGIRVSDADRDLALAELSEHFQTGRLTKEEFDDRSGRALQARTGRELGELFGDLPRSHADMARTVSSPAWGVSRSRTVRLAIACAVACVIIVDALFSSRSGHHVGFDLLPVLVVLFVIRRVRAR